MSSFYDLGLSPELAKSITDLGFTNPTKIQESSIPQLLSQDRDFICLAQTGSGKTAAFGLPLLEKVSLEDKHTQAVILSPTRELCLQITKDLANFSSGLKHKPKVVALYGGESISIQLKALREGPQIIVATAGRLVDIINQKHLDISKIRYLVLDEADEMLNMGFKDSLDFVMQKSSNGYKKIWLFSATMSKQVKAITGDYMSNILEIASEKNINNSNIEHIYYLTSAIHKYKALRTLIDYNSDMYGIIFCRTKIETQELVEKLLRDGYSADAIHGDLSQLQRNKVMSRYRDKLVNFLVATDVAARGIDVSNVTHVINYSLPDDPEVYVHRSGRTARAGNTGVSLCISTSRDITKLRMFERQIGKPFTKTALPSPKQICEKLLFERVNAIKNAEPAENITSYMDKVHEQLKDLSKEDIITRLISTELSTLLAHYGRQTDLNYTASSDEPSGDRKSRNGRRVASNKRLFINLGKVDLEDKRAMLKLLSKSTNLPDENISNVSMKDTYSFFEVHSQDLNKVLAAFDKNLSYNGRSLKLEVAKDSGRSRRPEAYNSSHRRAKDYGQRGNSSFNRRPNLY